MKIKLEKYNTDWKYQFETIRTEIVGKIGFPKLRVEHIGSTAVGGLSAKPIIDILVGLESASRLDEIVNPLLAAGYIYYPVYNDMMPYRRFFVKHKKGIENLGIPNTIKDDNAIPRSTEEHDLRLAHIHVLEYGSAHWIRHMAFRDYLRVHPAVRMEYQALKESLGARDWSDGNDYNRAKDAFIKIAEGKAIKWYTRQVGR